MDKQYSKAVDPSNLVSIRYSLVADVERRLKLISYHKKKVLVKLSNMRVSGQGLKLMDRIDHWISVNFEGLYKNKNLKDQFGKLTASLIKVRPKNLSSEELKRLIFHDNLIRFVERQVMKKRKGLRKKKIANFVHQLDPSTEVIARDSYLDRQIEKMGFYFSAAGDTAWEKGVVALIDEVWKLHPYKTSGGRYAQLYDEYVDKIDQIYIRKLMNDYRDFIKDSFREAFVRHKTLKKT